MLDNRALRADFEEKISPHLEVLLQFSLWLTKNGRDATRLMRAAMSEAYRSWDELTPEESYVRVHNILTRCFLVGKPGTEHSNRSGAGEGPSASAVTRDRLVSSPITEFRRRSWLMGELEGNVNYFEAFASLPTTLRSTMILSHLEGFSNAEIADLSGVESRVIEDTLSRGRRFMREQLFAHLMGEREADADTGREALTG